MILQLRNEGLVFRGQVSLCENTRAASGALLIFAEVVSMRERKTEADSANCCFLGLFMCPEGLSERFSSRLKQVGGMHWYAEHCFFPLTSSRIVVNEVLDVCGR
jgi:hypothetical protein